MSDKAPYPSSHSTPPKAQDENLSVLVIEKNLQLLNKLQDTLQAFHYKVFSETSSESVRQRDDLASFAAILLDHQLSNDLLSPIRQAAPNVPILLMSEQPDAKETAKALWEGASDYLIKPISPAVLRMSLKQASSQPRPKDVYLQERAFSDDLLEMAPAIVLVLDIEGQIVRFNAFMEELSGHSLDEVEGRNWLDVFLPEEYHLPIQELLQQTFSGKSVPPQISPMLTRNGKKRQISWHFRTFPDAEGNTSGFLVVGCDVTDSLGNIQKKKRRTERLAVIGQTIAGVSHEARNNLHAMKMGLNLLQHALDDRDEALEIVEEMTKEHDRLARLFEDVRGFAAPMKLERSQLYLPDVWQKAWASLETKWAGRNAVLHEEIIDPNTICFGDGFRLEEVFRNLFENSLAACSDPVEIHITCTPTKLDGREAVSIRVCDNGPGLTPDQQKKLFDPFFTTKSGGTGLGMPLTKRIIKAHGGTIEVNPERISGAEFLITLPVADEKSQ